MSTNTVSPFGIKWVYQSKGGVQAGQKPALCFRGRKYMLCVIAGHPVRIIKRPVAEFTRCRECTKGQGGQPYELALGVEKLREIAARSGCTKATEHLLDKAAAYAASRAQPDVDEDEYQDEEEVTMETTNPTNTGEQPEATEAQVSNSNSNAPKGAKETTVATKGKKATKVKAKAASKAPAKAKAANKVPAKAKKDKGPSRISRAVEYMREEVKKAGGQKNLERGWRKELFERAGTKFDLSPTTCSIQYNKQVLHK